MIVVLMVAAIGGLPGLIPRANAAPGVVTVAVYDLDPFVITHGDVKSGFTIDLSIKSPSAPAWKIS